MLYVSDDLNVVSFVLSVLAFIMTTKLTQLVGSRLPHAHLKEVDEALAEARTHVQLLVDGGNMTEEKAANAHLRISKLEKRRGELWLEVDRWSALGWKRFVHPSLKELLCRCSDLLRRIAALRKGLRHDHLQVSSVSPAEPSRKLLLSTPSTSNTASSASSIETFELSSPLASSSLSTNPVPSNVTRLDELARPSGSGPHQRLRPQKSQLTPTDAMPQSSTTAYEHISTSTKPGSNTSVSSPSVPKSALDSAPSERDVQTVDLKAGPPEDMTSTEPNSHSPPASPTPVSESALDSVLIEQDVRTQLPDTTRQQEAEDISDPEMTLDAAIKDGQQTQASGVETSLTHGTGTVTRRTRRQEAEEEKETEKDSDSSDPDVYELGLNDKGQYIWMAGPNKGFRFPDAHNLPKIYSRILRGQDLTAEYGARQVEEIRNMNMSEYWEDYPFW